MAAQAGARPGSVPPDVVAWPWDEARRCLEAGGWRVRRRLTGDGNPADAAGRVERVIAVRLAGGDEVEAVVAAFPAGDGEPGPTAGGPPPGGSEAAAPAVGADRGAVSPAERARGAAPTGPAPGAGRGRLAARGGAGGRARPAPQGAAADPEDGALPRHVAIIMDGNRRWARRHGSDTDTGHRAGVISLRGIVRVCSRLGIGYLTCYAFSTENWKRSEGEVNGLWALASEFLRTELPELIRQGVRVRIIGARGRLPLLVRQAAAAAEAATAGNRGLVLTLALNYGARQEIVSAARALCDAVAAGRLRPEAVDAEAFAAHLETAGLPDPDLLIRTSGERRISNFLLWQIAYSEIWMTDALWPDFGEADLLDALEDYRRRDRRYGGGGTGGDGSAGHRGQVPGPDRGSGGG